MARLESPVEHIANSGLSKPGTSEHHTRSALVGGALQAWRSSVALSDRVPVIGWWAMLIVVLTSGAMANVFMSFRVDEARLQLAQIERASDLQQQINAELLRRIGAQEDLDQISIWAFDQGLQPESEPIWMIATEPVLAGSNNMNDASTQPETPTHRRNSLAQGLKNFDDTSRQFWRSTKRGLGNISLLPPAPAAELDGSEPVSTAQIWLDRLFEYLRGR